VAGKEQLRARDVLRADPEDASESFDEWAPTLESEEIADVPTGRRAEKTEQDDQNDRVVPRDRPGRGRQ